MKLSHLVSFNRTAGLLLIAASGALAGCGEQSEEEARANVIADALNNPTNWSLWSTHSISVCFTAATADNASLATWRSSIPTWLSGSISTAANLTFTGFGKCGSNTNNMITITYDSTRGNSQGSPGWQGANAPSPITFGNDGITASKQQGVVIHEFMHTIGFSHEFNRSENAVAHDCFFELDQGGNTFGTPYDHFSIMNDTYCGIWNALSPWDMIGLRAAYGKRSAVHGFMIKSDRNSTLAVNAWGGAAEGTQLRLHNACTATNPDCTFTYMDGMLLSDSDPTLAINALNGAKEGASLVLTRACTRDNPDCTWTYKKGEFLSDRNPALAVNAVNGAVHGAFLKTTAACTASNPDCTWTVPNVMVPSARDSSLNWNAFNGAAFLTPVKLSAACDKSNPDCTWTFSKGMITSDRNSTLAVNAFNGAVNGADLKLHNACTASNTDCTFTWKHGEILSDTNSALVANAFNGATDGAQVKLVNNCSTSNPDCIFWSWIAK